MSWGILLRYGTKFGAIGVSIIAFIIVLLLLAVCLLSVFSLEIVDFQYVAKIPFSSLSFMSDYYLPYCVAFNGSNNRVFCASYVSLYFPNRVFSNVGYTGICIINDITSEYSTVDSFYDDMSNGGRVRLGKTNFVQGFVLPYNLIDVLGDNVTESHFLPHEYYIENGNFPPYYELQTISLDYFINFENGVATSVSYSLPEGGLVNYPYVNLFVGPYYWFNGMIFSSQFIEFEIQSLYDESPIFNPSEYDSFLTFAQGLFNHLDRCIDSLAAMIGCLFYGFQPFNLFFAR